MYRLILVSFDKKVDFKGYELCVQLTVNGLKYSLLAETGYADDQ